MKFIVIYFSDEGMPVAGLVGAFDPSKELKGFEWLKPCLPPERIVQHLFAMIDFFSRNKNPLIINSHLKRYNEGLYWTTRYRRSRKRNFETSQYQSVYNE
jgi:hypothetical protein